MMEASALLQRDRTVPVPNPYPRATYAWYVVGVLLLAGIVSFLDRQILSLLVGPVRHDLQITDTQVSLLQGLSFAMLFSFIGLPVGHLVDRANRRNIIAFGLLVWSIMTMLCGLATNFSELFAARVGVGVGEACLGPAAVSLISDYFAPSRRGRALSIYVMSTNVGIGASLAIGGLLLHLLHGSNTLWLPVLGRIAGWKAVLILAGLPGLAVLPLILTIRETPRRESIPGTSSPGEAADFRQFFGFLSADRRTYFCLYLALGLVSFMGYGAGSWSPTFFIRHFGLAPATAGLRVGAITAIAGLLGCLTSGWVSDRFARRNTPGGRFRVTLLGFSAMVPAVIAFPMMPNLAASMTLFACFTFANAFSIASGPPALQAVMPNRLRGKATALYYLLLAVFGVATGPTMVALATDHLFRGDKYVGRSISLVPAIAGVLGISVVSWGLRTYQRRNTELQQQTA